MQFPPEVERWRSLVEKYFPADLVDKALWTIQHESSGNPNAIGDNGAARSLFQIQTNQAIPGRPDAAFLDDPERNIKFAAQNLGAANGDFKAWGENNLYQGKPFGAFGNNVWPGEGGSNLSTNANAPQIPSLPYSREDYYKKVARRNVLLVQIYTPDGKDFNPGIAPDDPRITEFQQLTADMQQFEDALDGGAQEWKDYYDWLDRMNETDPGRIDAENSANKYAREFAVNQQATSDTANDLVEQRQTQDSAIEEFGKYKGSNHFEAGAFRAPSMDLATKDELFSGNVDRISKNLPAVKDLPYPTRPGTDFRPSGPFGTSVLPTLPATPTQSPGSDDELSPAAEDAFPRKTSWADRARSGGSFFGGGSGISGSVLQSANGGAKKSIDLWTGRWRK